MHTALSLRPSLPYLLVCALGMWAASAAVYLGARTWPHAVCFWVALASGVACAALLIVCLMWAKGEYLASMLLGLALGCFCASAGACSLHAAADKAEQAKDGIWTFALAEDASRGQYGSQALAHAVSSDGESFTVLLFFEECEGARYFGDTFTSAASFSAPREAMSVRCWQKGAVTTVHARNVEQVTPAGVAGFLRDVRSAAIRAFGDAGAAGAGADESALLQALVCGFRAPLSESLLYDDFKATGLAHMVAVSGAHLVIVSGFARALLRALRTPKGVGIALQIAFVFSYLVFAAMPVSAIRAAIMSVLGSASYFSRRRPAPLNALALCIVGMIAIFPQTSVSVSFALSAGSTLGIVLLSGLVTSWFEDMPFKLPGFVRDALVLTLASGVVTAPASAALFAQTSFAGPLANVLCGPLFVVACTAGLVAALVSVACPALAALACTLAAYPAHVLVELVRFLAALPFACAPVCAPVFPSILLSIALVAALWWFWPRVRVAHAGVALSVLAAAFALRVALSPLLAGNEIVMLDVGQGDAFLVRSEGRAILIDTGNKDQMLREGLARHDVWHLDAVVISHADDDHCASLDSLRDVVGVDAVYVAVDALTCECSSCAALRASACELVGESSVFGLCVGDVLQCGAIDLDVLWPFEFLEEGGNADSLCVLASFDPERDGMANWTALFCGDVEAKQIEQLQRLGYLGQVDIYKVGHHGSRAALDDATVQALSPSIALVSVGANNRYGHPAAETIDRLESVGARILRSDEVGDVSCKLEASSLSVTTLR